LDISVRASVSGDGLKLTDTSGLSTTPFTVIDLADGHAAEDLGLTGIAAVAGVITGADINYLSTATTLNAINDGRGIRLASSGNGIQVVDNSGGAGALTIAESGGGTTAADLGLLGSAAAGATAISGKNLQRQWVSANSLLADYNGGKGVSPGSFRITNSKGN